MKETQFEDEIDLREIFQVFWLNRIKIISVTAVFALVSVIYAFSVPNQYKAEMLLAPAQSGSDDLSGISKQLSGLASLAGVGIGDNNSTEGQIAQEVMKSWSFIEGFISKNNIAVEVYAAEGWERSTDKLKFDDDLYDVASKKWLVEDKNTGEIGPPSSWELFEAFSERLSVSEDLTSGLVSLTIEHYSPNIAKLWSDLYLAAINEHMQQREIIKVNNNINYLNDQIEQTSISETKEILFKIIEEQLKNKMLAEASPEFAFVVVSPSMIPDEKSQPQRALICILGTLLGGLLSLLLVSVMYYTRRLK